MSALATLTTIKGTVLERNRTQLKVSTLCNRGYHEVVNAPGRYCDCSCVLLGAYLRVDFVWALDAGIVEDVIVECGCSKDARVCQRGPKVRQKTFVCSLYGCLWVNGCTIFAFSFRDSGRQLV